MPMQGPPAAEFFQMRAQQLRTPRMDFDVAPPFPMPGGGAMEAKDPAVRAIQQYQQTLTSKLDAVVTAINKQGSLNVAVV
jgi:hypothetical protein